MSLEGALPAPSPARPIDAGRRALRAAGVAVVWAVGVAPAALGWQTCTFARVFHAPCPGCGMTRAGRMLLAGDWRGSLAMHPLAVPVAAAWGLFIAVTVWTTFERGAPFIHQTRLGRASLAILGVVYAAAIALWIARAAGLFGGPVAVYD